LKAKEELQDLQARYQPEHFRGKNVIWISRSKYCKDYDDDDDDSVNI
jgi:hypothetical protein